MIPRETIEKIVNAAAVEEVVGDYVTLKKRGVNHVGLCPFHDEKTPSFTVSPSKGIYKCFGCGAGGNAVNFLMQHEQLSYPEALKLLAKKYGIEIEEQELTPEQKEEQSERESLFIVSAFAKDFFTEYLHNSQEGQAIGLSYLRERGMSDEMITQFELGYAPESNDMLLRKAQEAGYKEDYLIKTGLAKKGEHGMYDGYRGRIMFPIHNLSGRVVGFGGRALKQQAKAKYINTPECAIYNKRALLYGLYFAKRQITKEQNCYLVEGYTDVISLHQAGIVNAVASSGTSLTEEQVRLIRRYTHDITILYDGDPAGIKASNRGIDLVLAQGMNVKIVLFPDGEDPDSYARKTGADGMREFITENAVDFISFKTGLLLEDVKDDPVEKTRLLHEIISSIAIVPDQILRASYIRECSRRLDMEERALMGEMSRIHRKMLHDKAKKVKPQEDDILPVEKLRTHQFNDLENPEAQEREIIRLLLNYGQEKIEREEDREDGTKVKREYKVADFVIRELDVDEINISNSLYARIYNTYKVAHSEGRELSHTEFVNHSDNDIRVLASDLLSTKYELHNWKSHEIQVVEESECMPSLVESAIYALKSKWLMKMIRDNQDKLKAAQQAGQDVTPILKMQKQMDDFKCRLSAMQGRIILK